MEHTQTALKRRRRARRDGAVLLWVGCFGWAPSAPVVDGRLPCNSSLVCAKLLLKGSECLESGYCSNPFYKRGCLANLLPESVQKARKRSFVRQCHSEDPPEAEALGYCRNSPFDYGEVRMMAQNWDTAFFNSWILQIILSEILSVPTTLETGKPGSRVNFYHEDMPMDYNGLSTDLETYQTGNNVVDCRRVANQNPYQPCAQVAPEVWNGHLFRLQDVKTPLSLGLGLGALQWHGWYIPQRVADMDPSLLSYTGLQGPENRRKLAAMFPRPTTWWEYCTQESTDNCSAADATAVRAPRTKEEADAYFIVDLYAGFFRNTTENDCDTWPDNCTGHIADFDCQWYSPLRQQKFHLDIGVASSGNADPISNGYSRTHMEQIWRAANATDSNVMMYWWQPQSLFVEMADTSMAFTRISLPMASQRCVEHRVPWADYCSAALEDQVGDALGSCDESPQILFKMMGSGLRELSFPEHLSDGLHSPAWETIRNYKLSELYHAEILENWLERNVDRGNYDARHAVCKFVVDHLDLAEFFVPDTHPRVLIENENDNTPLFASAIALASLAIAMTLVSCVTTYWLRTKPSIKNAQIEFLGLLLSGLLLVSAAGLMTALPPEDGICVAIAWFSNMGYSLELVPLICKVAAINRLHAAAQHMRRVTVRKKHLFFSVSVITFLVAIWLIVWTVIDPPQKKSQVSSNGDTTEDGEFTIVERSYYCGADSNFWPFIGIAWQALLLLASSILAFQTRHVHRGLNEANTLAILVYSHFVWAICRAITFVLELNKSDLAGARSIIYSADVITALGIYFLPKFMAAIQPQGERSQERGKLFRWNLAEKITGVAHRSDNVRRRSVSKEEGDNGGNGEAASNMSETAEAGAAHNDTTADDLQSTEPHSTDDANVFHTKEPKD